MAAMTSFHAEECCHLLSENETSAARLYAAAYSTVSTVHRPTFVLVSKTVIGFANVLRLIGFRQNPRSRDNIQRERF